MSSILRDSLPHTSVALPSLWLFLAAITCSHMANAAATERTDQSILPFFEKGNYAELSYTYVDPDLPGKELATGATSSGSTAMQYSATTAAVKFSPKPDVAVALLYDEPFGADYKYASGNLYNGSEAFINTRTLTALVGQQFASRFWLYGGPVFSESDFELKFDGAYYAQAGLPTGYQFKQTDSGVSLGFVGGAAYVIPDIALRLALTYRSEIEAKSSWEQSYQGGPLPFQQRAITKMPQNINLNFQTGINPTTLLTADIRWVNFGGLDIEGPFLGNPRDVATYADDSISATVGLGKKLSDKLSGVVRLKYDTGTGLENAPIFGAYDDLIGIQLGGKYQVNKHVDAALGVSYVHAGDGYTVTPTGQKVATFEGGSAVAVSGKLGWHF